ncbi:TPA: hypothetical protein JG828_004478 [Vibrio parahaemolyticus]|nr:hypothetical protein [Vibrio parahaemolyticus]
MKKTISDHFNELKQKSILSKTGIVIILLCSSFSFFADGFLSELGRAVASKLPIDIIESANAGEITNVKIPIGKEWKMHISCEHSLSLKPKEIISNQELLIEISDPSIGTFVILRDKLIVNQERVFVTEGRFYKYKVIEINSKSGYISVEVESHLQAT